VRGDARKVELNRKRKAVVADASRWSCTGIEAVSGLLLMTAVRKKEARALVVLGYLTLLLCSVTRSSVVRLTPAGGSEILTVLAQT